MTPLRRLFAGLLIAALPAAQAALDADARTDDHSINVPTSWWTFSNLTPTQLQGKIDSLGARVVEVEVTSVLAGVPRMTVRLVKDSGDYAVTGDAFAWGQTQSQLESLLATAGGRLIELERYDAGGGDIRYVSAYVPNSGNTARAWGWLPGRTRSEIASWASANNARIIDLDSHGSGSGRRWDAVLVANTGSDYKRWDWDVDQTLAQVAARLSSFRGRLVKLERQGDGKYSFVQVDNSDGNASAWWWAVGLSSLGAVNNFAAQMGGRPIDIVPYTQGRATVYDAVVIDNANSATRAVRAKFFEAFLDDKGWPIGIFEAYLKRADTGEVLVNLNASRRAETASALKALHLLHAMKQVNAGDALGSSFTYYNYPTTQPDPKDACPDPSYENNAHEVQTTLEAGLDAMMNDSDNRTTRGVVLRYGGFAPLNSTAAAAGLKNTELRHNIGCGYGDPGSGRYAPDTLRNDTTAADLSAIWLGVLDGSLLPVGSLGRTEFLESGNPATGADAELQAIIDQEAAALGLGASDAAAFGARVRTWSKGGKYYTCLGDPANPTECGQKVSIRSTAGLLSLPIGGGRYSRIRNHAFASLMSDVPVPARDSPEDQLFVATRRAAHYEMFRSAVRSALLEW
jgi:hypothetical protein